MTLKQENGKIWIEEALHWFNELIGRFEEHKIISGKEEYLQPFVYLSFHLIQMNTSN